MTDLHSPIEELNEQLQELLNEWTSEISLVLRELADKRARVAELQAGFDKRGEKVAEEKPREQEAQEASEGDEAHLGFERPLYEEILRGRLGGALEGLLAVRYDSPAYRGEGGEGETEPVEAEVGVDSTF